MKNFASFKEKHLYWSLFLIKIAGLDPTHVFSRETYEIFKNIYFEEHLWTTASKNQYVTEKTIHRFLSQNYYNLRGLEVSSVLLCSFC